MWANPLSDVIGTWGIYNAKGEFTTECIENLSLFIPFAFLLMWSFGERLVARLTIWSVLRKATTVSFLFSLTIETLPLLLHLGTWQLSDLFYNTLGGIAGGLCYWLFILIKRKV